MNHYSTRSSLYHCKHTHTNIQNLHTHKQMYKHPLSIKEDFPYKEKGVLFRGTFYRRATLPQKNTLQQI